MSESLSVPEQIRLKFAEAEGLIIEQEKNMEMKMRKVVRERDSLKKEVGVVEEKLGNSERKCEELDMKIVEKEVKIEKLWDVILDVGSQLERKGRECEEVDSKIVEKEVKIERVWDEVWEVEEKLKIKGRECEELTRTVQELRVKKAQSDEDARVYKARVHDLEAKAKSVMNMEIEMGKVVKERDSLNKKIVEKEEKISEVKEKLEWKGRECEELKRKEIEVEGVVQELRVSKMESDKDAQLYKSRVHDLEVKMSKVKANLAGLVGSMNDTNFTDHFVENREVVILSNKAGASSKAPIARRCDLGIIDQIKKNLEKNNLKRFENSCFGHFLKVKKLQYQGPLILHMVQSMDMSASNEERLVFNINNSNINFGPTEFSLMTGLRLGTFEAATPSSSSIHSNVFQGNPRILLKDIKDAFLATSRDNEGKGELTLKLALLYFLYGVLLARSRRVNRIELQYLNLTEDIDNFNTFPWGRVAYDFLVSSILAVGDRVHGSDQVTYGRAGLDIHGFNFAVQAWAYEVMPRVAAYCASRAKNFNNVTPQILRWSATKGVRFNNLSKFFPPTHLKNAVVKEEEPSSVPQQKKRKSNLIEEGRCGYSRALDLRVRPCDDSRVQVVRQSFRFKRKVRKFGEEERRKKISAEDEDDMESPVQKLNDVDSDDEPLVFEKKKR